MTLKVTLPYATSIIHLEGELEKISQRENKTDTKHWDRRQTEYSFSTSK
jgi:hypothetical protein